MRRGDVIAVIGDADLIYAKLSVDETNISKIKVGQEVILQLNTVKDKTTMAASPKSILRLMSSRNRFCKAIFNDKLDFPYCRNPASGPTLLPPPKNALVIPKVFLSYGNMVRTKDKGEVSVKTGFISGDWVEILEGIDENTTLITDQIK